MGIPRGTQHTPGLIKEKIALMLEPNPDPIHHDDVGIRTNGGSLLANNRAIDAYAPCVNPLFTGTARRYSAGGKEFL